MAVAGMTIPAVSAAPEATAHTTPAPIDREYWLAHCEGYRVDSDGGRVGLVEAVRLGDEGLRAESIVVLAGMYGRHRIVFDASEVEAIVPRAQRLVLRRTATTSASISDAA